MKNMLNIALLISCSCLNSELIAGGDNLYEEEERRLEAIRYAQCNDDFEFALRLQNEEFAQRDLKHSQQHNHEVPNYHPQHVAFANQPNIQFPPAHAYIVHAAVEQQTQAEQRRNADAKRKQLLIDERESLYQTIKVLERNIHIKRLDLNLARYSFEIDNLRKEIRDLEKQKSQAIKRCEYLDREINRSLEHDDREIERRENETRYSR